MERIMPEPQQQKQPTDPVRHLLVGSVPALAAAGIALTHLRAPLVRPEHQTLLAMMCLALICTSLAAWLHYTVEHECRGFDERHDELAAAVDKIAESLAAQHEERMQHIERLERAIQGIHRRAEAIERQGKALGEAFVEEGNPLSSYRGPRPLT